MQEWIETAIEGLVEMTQLSGHYLLLLTVPLTIIQGIITIFPFATLLLLHVSSLGLMQGLFISWVLGTIASIVCFMLGRSFIQAWIIKRFGTRLAKYEKWQRHMDHYGVWVVILLRSVPFVPSNVTSIMAAISPLSFNAYLWSTAVGTFSQIWMFGLLGSTVIFPNIDLRTLWVAYIGFCAVLFAMFLLRLLKEQRSIIKLGGSKSEENQTHPANRK
ncbi:TVP38/TMEM64 family protein [Paenibacillus abyssi]|uniref:TVP38/TMEM64 family membrane protein n=1 Tax=Paenibacillus abyssi TaxID=1340531 RepID=A0A917LH87_9BACL|nr:VTT domain-containing protein [Paenibacillus abyssi]GGG23428.1 hypothetical protein GCM10010916_45030 [Paenibacillus abyssi]